MGTTVTQTNTMFMTPKIHQTIETKLNYIQDTSYYLPDLINVHVMYLYPTYMAGPTLSTGHADKQGRLGTLEPTPNAKHWSSDSFALPSFRWPPRHQRDNFA